MNEVDRFRDHVADTIGHAIGPDRSVKAFAREAGMCNRALSNSMSGEHNIRVDTLAKIAEVAGYRVRLRLERLLTEDDYSLHFTIPGLPHCNPAARMNRWALIEEKKKWIEAVHYATVGKRPKEPIVKAKAVFVRHSSREPDSDNLRYSFKYIRDALTSKHCRIILDDDPAHLGAEYRWEKARIKKSFVEVRVEEA